MLGKRLKRKNALSIFISLLFFVAALALPFVGGLFSPDTQLEKNAQYATRIVKDNTNNKKYCCLTVQSSNDSGPILDSNTEFHTHYGAFRQTKVTFAPTINPDKKHNIEITYNDKKISKNLSALYVGPIGTDEFNGKLRHYTYPIDVMFEDQRMYDVSENIMYISQTHADKILSEKGEFKNAEGTFSKELYESLVKTIVPVNVDGELFDFAIQNIFYESNYYYEGLADVVGDFVLVSYFMPKNLRAELQNMYFMSDYDYQNMYFMKYIRNAYSNGKYKVSLNEYNIVGNVDEDYLLSFYYSATSSSDFGTVISLVIAAGLLICGLVSFYVLFDKRDKVLYFLYFGSLLVPYIIFYCLYFVTNNVAFLSQSGTKSYLILVIISFALLLIAPIVKENRIIEKIVSRENKNDFSEIEI